MTSRKNEPLTGEKVALRLEKIPGVLEEDLLIAVNGVNYLIPRGRSVELPAHVAEEYRRSVRALECLFDTQDKLSYREPTEQELSAEADGTV